MGNFVQTEQKNQQSDGERQAHNHKHTPNRAKKCAKHDDQGEKFATTAGWRGKLKEKQVPLHMEKVHKVLDICRVCAIIGSKRADRCVGSRIKSKT